MVLNKQSQLWGCPSDTTYQEEKSSLISDCGPVSNKFPPRPHNQRSGNEHSKCPETLPTAEWEFSGSLTTSWSSWWVHSHILEEWCLIIRSWLLGCVGSAWLYISQEGSWSWQGPSRGKSIIGKSDRKTIHTFSVPSSPVTQMLASSPSSDGWLKLWPISSSVKTYPPSFMFLSTGSNFIWENSFYSIFGYGDYLLYIWIRLVIFVVRNFCISLWRDLHVLFLFLLGLWQPHLK